MTFAWYRVRPGLYSLRRWGKSDTANSAEEIAIVERGAETQRWWWSVHEHDQVDSEGEEVGEMIGGFADFETRLRDAKLAVVTYLHAAGGM